jgi:hypothetical protein
MAEDTRNLKKPEPVPCEPQKPSNEKPDFVPPKGFGPDFVKKVAGETKKK